MSTTTPNAAELATKLALHNRWRRGDEDVDSPRCAELGFVIDDAVSLLRTQAARITELEAALAQQPPTPAACWSEGFAAGEGWRRSVDEFWRTNVYGASPAEPANPYKYKAGAQVAQQVPAEVREPLSDTEWLAQAIKLAHGYADAKLIGYGLFGSPERADPDAAFAALEAHLRSGATELGDVYAELRKQRPVIKAVFDRAVWDRAEAARLKAKEEL